MKSYLTVLIILVFAVSCTDNKKSATDISMSPLFADNMVLQRSEPVKIWGKASPGGEVKIVFENQEKSSIAATDSTWSVTLDPLKAGGPFELKVIGKDTLIFKNVLIGEVWICSGQSNMEMPLNLWGDKKYEQEIKKANYPGIRLLTVKNTMSLSPSDKLYLNEKWEPCSPDNAGDFSAVGFFFAKELHNKLKVPIGMIHSSWGGTPVEAWTPADALFKINEFVDVIKSFSTFEQDKDSLWAVYYQKIDKWKKDLDSLYSEKIGKITWESPELNDSEWGEMSLPGYWEKKNEKMKDVNGIVWFRRTFKLNDNPKNKKYILNLGCIDDQDVVYINGKIVGSRQMYDDERAYPIDSNILKAGENLIAVMVRDYGGSGGFSGTPEEMYISDKDGKRTELDGIWKYKVLTNDPNRKILWSSNEPTSPNRPTVLYNAMINPLIPYSIRGTIWYQGESNVGRAEQYRKVFPAMISSWREKWGEGDFPFFFVQLSNFKERMKEPAPSDMAMLREAQTFALSLPNTGIATAVDVGEADNIHFKNKKAVGHRLALNALNKTYGMDIPYSGPVFKELEVKGSKIIVHFNHIDGGLKTNDGKAPRGFAIAGHDGKYKWAEAKIEGNTIVLWNNLISEPVSVRYAWADNPDINLYNGAGLPALPFRTDSFEK
ncbi:MAG: 9-O-acetylesterase [Chlorobi bacterium]|nr:9-O-acetylesterase [Chlorobiota bacterium]